jgi:2-enoate reductase
MTPEVAAEAIKEGKLDGMGVARQFLADPAWVTKMMAESEDEIRPCICCHNGCFNMAHYKGVGNDQDLKDATHMARCAINAETMQTTSTISRRPSIRRPSPSSAAASAAWRPPGS